MPVSLHLLRHIRFRGTLTAKSGLRIGAPRDDIEIGASDAPVLRHPLTRIPYIPGSSIKGKLRSALEYRHNKINPNTGQPCGCANLDCLVCRLFGPHLRPTHGLGPTRLLARDASLTDASITALSSLQDAGLMYVELKNENMIDRRTGVAAGGRGLRSQERVPAGAVFEFGMTLRVFADDGVQQHLNFLQEGLALMQEEYLGGSGSRGYGEIELSYRVLDGTNVIYQTPDPAVPAPGA